MTVRVIMDLLAVACGTGPRETLQERLKMFYSYWNPSVCLSSCLPSVFLLPPTRVLLSPSYLSRPVKSIVVVWYDFAECGRRTHQKMSKAAMIVQQFKGSEDLVNEVCARGSLFAHEF